jgi:hypothetical protein
MIRVLLPFFLFACGHSEPALTDSPEELAASGEPWAGPPIGCYCRCDGLFIGADGEPSMMDGSPMGCSPVDVHVEEVCTHDNVEQ